MSVTRREQLQRECDDTVDGDALGCLSNDVTRWGQLHCVECDDKVDGDASDCLPTDVTRWGQLQCVESDDMVDGDAVGCCGAMDGDTLGLSVCCCSWWLPAVDSRWLCRASTSMLELVEAAEAD